MTVAFDGNVDLTLEVGFGSDAKSAAVSWTDISGYLRGVEIRRGRSHAMDKVNAGSMTVHLDNSDRRFDPTNTASPYYPNVIPSTPVRVTATYNLVDYPLFRGTVDGWPLEFPEKNSTVISRIEATDDFKLISQDSLAGSYAEESSDTRIGNMLDDVDWPAARRNLETGVRDVVATVVNCINPLQEIQRVVDTEVGLFYMAANGDATYENQNHRDGIAFAGTFGDRTTDLPFSDVKVGYDDTQIWNSVIGTRVGNNETRNVEDSGSVATYGRRHLRINDLLATDTTNLNAVIDQFLAKYAQPQLRVERLEVLPQKNPSVLWPHVLGADVSARYALHLTFAVGTPSTLDMGAFVEGIRHSFSVSPRSWSTTWELSQALPPLTGRVRAVAKVTAAIKGDTELTGTVAAASKTVGGLALGLEPVPGSDPRPFVWTMTGRTDWYIDTTARIAIGPCIIPLPAGVSTTTKQLRGQATAVTVATAYFTRIQRLAGTVTAVGNADARLSARTGYSPFGELLKGDPIFNDGTIVITTRDAGPVG